MNCNCKYNKFFNPCKLFFEFLYAEANRRNALRRYKY